MKAPLLASIALVLFCSAPSVSRSQFFRWQEGPGPEGGHVRSIAYSRGGTAYLTVDGHGIFYAGGGLSFWQNFQSVPTPRGAALIHVTCYVGALLHSGSDSLLRRSPYSGAGWATVLRDLNWEIPIVRDSAYGMIAAGWTRLYRSVDDGITWTPTGSATNGTTTALAVGSDGRLVVGVRNGYSAPMIQVSTDLGKSWRSAPIGDSTTPAVLSLAATTGGGLLAGTGGRELFRSADGGNTWMLLPKFSAVDVGRLLALPDGSVVAGTDGAGLFRSVDGGTSWTSFGGTQSTIDVTALAAGPGGRLMVGTLSSGLYLVDSNRSLHTSRNLPRIGIKEIALAPEGITYVIGTDGRLYRSTAEPGAWSEPGPFRGHATVMAVDRANRVYAGSSRYPDFGVIVSTDRGAGWLPTGVGIAKERVLALLVDRHDHVYAGVDRGGYSYHTSTSDGLYRSTDGGESWISVGSGLKGISPASILSLEDGTLIVGAAYGQRRVLRLDVGDSLWRDVSIGLPRYRYPWMLNALLADRSGNLYAALERGLFRSSDRGDSWQRTGEGFGDSAIASLASMPDGTILAATAAHKVFASDSNGLSWRYLTTVPGSARPDLMTVDSAGMLIAGGSDGLYRGKDGIATIPRGNTPAPGALAAVPNPAGSRLSVTFELRAGGPVRLALFDIAGREVALLGDGPMSQGRHRVEIDCARHLPGSYLLRLEAGESSDAIPLMIAR